ncbi:MAG TPA: proteasome subunit beta [Acidimicrobiia bacterium]|jgi:proteasome beta subunit
MFEHPLPLFAPGLDPGPSFADLLQRVLPEGALGRPWARDPQANGSAVEIVHGTTVVAIRFATGVVMAGDRRATAGNSIAGRRMEKVAPADDWSGIAIAGAAGMAVEMVRLFQTQIEHYEKVQGDSLSLEGKANQLAQMVRANLPMAMQGFVVVPLYAGFDQRRERGRVFTFDATGGRYEELDYAANGSGSIHARNWIKAGWNAELTADQAVELALRSLFAAADEDTATGGPDLVRRIYPTVAVIDDAGYRQIPDDEVGERAQALLGGPERGGTEVQA